MVETALINKGEVKDMPGTSAYGSKRTDKLADCSVKFDISFTRQKQ